MIGKTYTPADYENGRMHDLITLKYKYANKSSKPVDGVTGTFVISDEFGKHIADWDDKITQHRFVVGEYGDSSDSWDFNQFEGKDIEIRDTPVERLKIRWVTKSVLFSDGTKLEGENSDSSNGKS